MAAFSYNIRMYSNQIIMSTATRSKSSPGGYAAWWSGINFASAVWLLGLLGGIVSEGKPGGLHDSTSHV
jgi:hypothetical protein